MVSSRADVRRGSRTVLCLLAAATLAGGCAKPHGLVQDAEAESAVKNVPEAATPREATAAPKTAQETQERSIVPPLPLRNGPAGDPAPQGVTIPVPMEVTDFHAAYIPALFGVSPHLHLNATVTQRLAADDMTMLLVHSACRYGDRVVVDATTMAGSSYEAIEIGGVGKLEARLYAVEFDRPPEACQLTLRLGHPSGGLSIPLGQRCWTGGTVADGECARPVVAVPASTSTAVNVADVAMRVGERNPGHLAATYFLDVDEAGLTGTNLQIKAVCKVGGRSLVALDWGQIATNVNMPIEPGESLLRGVDIYFEGANLADAEHCALDFTALRVPDVHTMTVVREHVGQACWRGGTVTPTACSTTTAPPPPPSPPAKDSVSLSDVTLTALNHGTPGDPAWIVQLSAGVTVDKGLPENTSLSGDFHCKAGPYPYRETSGIEGIDLQVLAPGEFSERTTQVFGMSPLKHKPTGCSVTVSLDSYRYPGTTGVTLGKWCLGARGTYRC